MFRVEARGLARLRESETIRIPKVLGQGETAEGAFLLLEYLEPGQAGPASWTSFGESLANLHRVSGPHFGLDHDNYIGSLPQSNRQHAAFLPFFIEERIQPQMEHARSQGLLDPKDEGMAGRLYDRLPSLLPEEPPALIHGDLWGGNFLFDQQGEAYLIDPAVCLAHREMDLAMSKLFGGFSPSFYAAYQERYPLQAGWEERVPLFQLYYLLVHVNLFGQGYVGSVRNILRKYGG